MFFNVQGGCFLRACFRAQNDSIERGFLTCSSGSCENVSNMSLSNDIDVEGRLPRSKSAIWPMSPIQAFRRRESRSSSLSSCKLTNERDGEPF
jgi:hypothetical protein